MVQKNRKIHILLVEDSPGDTRLIREMLKETNRLQCDITYADCLKKALQLFKRNSFELVLLDLNLPDSERINTFKKVQAITPDLPIVILTGIADEQLALKAMGEGAQDYIVKGKVDGESLVRCIRYAIERKHAHEELRLLIDHYPAVIYRFDKNHRYIFVNPAIERFKGKPPEYYIGKTIDELGYPKEECEYWKKMGQKVFNTGKSLQGEAEITGPDRKGYIYWYMVPEFDSNGKVVNVLSTEYDITERKYAEKALQKTLEGAVHALASTVAKRDPFTQSHQLKVTKLARCIAEHIPLSEKRIKGLRFASLLHDIGKISVPAEILTKPGRLTAAEYKIVKTHSQHAYDILKDIEFPWPIADIVLQHHERLDGSGYPQGLTDGEILLEARIIAVADVVEAMSSHRPYRPAPGLNKALEELRTKRGILYDTRVVDICVELFNKHQFNFNK